MSVPALGAVTFSPETSDSAEPLHKPLLVLGPSLGTSSTALWSSCAQALAENYEVIAWDLPGHGVSRPVADAFSIAELARAVIELADQVQAERNKEADSPFYYAGVSVGGAVGFQLELDYPHRIEAAAIICSAAKIGQREAWLERAQTVRSAGTPTMVTGSAQRWFAPGFLAAHKETSTALLHSLQAADRFSYAWASEALADFDVRDRLGAVHAPTLAMAGQFDQVASAADSEAIADGVRHGTSLVVDGVSHLAPAEAPDRVAAILRGFFAEGEQQ